MTFADPDRDLPDPGDEPARLCPRCQYETLVAREDICYACDASREAEREP